MIKITIEGERLTNKQKEYLLWFIFGLISIATVFYTVWFFIHLEDNSLTMNWIFGSMMILFWFTFGLMSYIFLLGYGLIKPNKKKLNRKRK